MSPVLPDQQRGIAYIKSVLGKPPTGGRLTEQEACLRSHPVRVRVVTYNLRVLCFFTGVKEKPGMQPAIRQHPVEAKYIPNRLKNEYY